MEITDLEASGHLTSEAGPGVDEIRLAWRALTFGC